MKPKKNKNYIFLFFEIFSSVESEELDESSSELSAEEVS